MTKKDQTLTHYRNVLKSLDVNIDEDSGQLLWDDGSGEVTPLTIDKKKLCLPLPKYLTDVSEIDKIHAFHPLSESSSPVISKTQARLIKIMEVQLNGYLTRLMITLVRASMDPKAQAVMKRGVRNGLTTLDEMNASTHDYIIGQLEKLDPSSKVSLIRMKAVNNAEIDGKRYLRGVRVYSPLFDALRKDDCDKFITAKFPNKKTHSVLLGIFALFFGDKRDVLIPKHDLRNHCCGVHSHVVPTYTSFLLAFLSVMVDVDYLCQKEFKKLLELYDETAALRKHHLDWGDYLKEIKTFVSEIPALPGNYADTESSIRMKSDMRADQAAEEDYLEEGPRKINRTLSDDSVQLNPVTPVPQASRSMQSQAQPVSDDGAISIAELNSRMNKYNVQPMQQNYAPQPMFAPQPQMQPQQMYQQPQPQQMYQQPQQMYQQPNQGMPMQNPNGTWGNPQPQQQGNWMQSAAPPQPTQQELWNGQAGYMPVRQPTVAERCSQTVSLLDVGKSNRAPQQQSMHQQGMQFNGGFNSGW